jgi:hypothetical protein
VSRKPEQNQDVARSKLHTVYAQGGLLLKNLVRRESLDTEVGQAASNLNLQMRVVQHELPQDEVVKGIRELMENGTVVEFIRHAEALKGALQRHLFRT